MKYYLQIIPFVLQNAIYYKIVFKQISVLLGYFFIESIIVLVFL